MDDLISRQAAIDALDALCDRECEYSKKQRSVMCGACHLGSAFDVIEQLPSAQPEKRTDKRTETHACDLVSRQAAIDAFEKELCDVRAFAVGFVGAKRILESVPSAQPEIIRCKDCRFAHLTYDGDCKYCQYLINEYDMTDAVYFDGDDFCSHAERESECVKL